MLEAAFDEELTNRIEEIATLSDEIVTLKATLEETLLNSKQKLQRADSSIEFDLLHAGVKQVHVVCMRESLNNLSSEPDSWQHYRGRGNSPA